MIAPFLMLAFHFAQHSKLQHGDLLSGCGCTLILFGIIQYVICDVNTFFKKFFFRVKCESELEQIRLVTSCHFWENRIYWTSGKHCFNGRYLRA